MIERVLTDAEKTAISHCLRKEAEAYDLRVEAILAGKYEDEEAPEQRLIDAALERVRDLNKVSCGLASLAVLIERSPVAAMTLVHFPETL